MRALDNIARIQRVRGTFFATSKLSILTTQPHHRQIRDLTSGTRKPYIRPERITAALRTAIQTYNHDEHFTVAEILAAQNIYSNCAEELAEPLSLALSVEQHKTAMSIIQKALTSNFVPSQEHLRQAIRNQNADVLDALFSVEMPITNEDIAISFAYNNIHHLLLTGYLSPAKLLLDAINKRTPLQAHQLLLLAVKPDHACLVAAINNRYASLVDKIVDCGIAPTHDDLLLAINSTNQQPWSIEEQPSTDILSKEQHQKRICREAQWKPTKIIHSLIKAGAPIDTEILSAAISTGSVTIVRLILATHQIHPSDEHMRQAIKTNNEVLVEALIESEAHFTEAQSANSRLKR